MTLTDFNKIDISSRTQTFMDLKNVSLRDRVRDFYDTNFRRPFYKMYYKNFFKNQNYKIDCTLPAKGFSNLKRIENINKYKKINGAKILNVGCGNAFTYHHLFRYKPQSIFGIDVLNYSKSWNNVKKYVEHNNINTLVEFRKIDVEDLDQSLKFDIIISEAVFEHCKNFEKVSNILSKVLNDDGILYSSYGGPLWYTYGGDHFSGRDNINNGYNHLLLDKTEYEDYFKKNCKDLNYELNEGGGGGVLVENDLFSKLSGNEYIEIFKNSGFNFLETIVELDPIALKLLHQNKTLKNQLLSKNLGVSFEDFYLKTHIVYLNKKN